MMSSRPAGSATLNWQRVSEEYDIPRIRELALGAIRQSVLIADGDHEAAPIIFANPAFAELSGYSAEEVIGQNCRFMNGPETSAITRAEIREAIADRRPYSGLILNYRKDGTAFWNNLSLTPVEDEALGRFWVGVQVDVTVQREMEARLRESQRMEAIGKLSGGIAHDFNNILALILGNAEIIAGDAADGSTTRDAAADIIEAADGGSRLVTRMLQYARGEGGRREDVALNTTIESMVAMLSRTIGEPIRLETDLSAAVGRITIDRPLLETALLNLILNARDAMPKGGVIRVCTRRRSNAGPSLGTAALVSVGDSGVGMDEATKIRAFEPFFTTKQVGRGNGLGLAMVYNFVKQAGGDVAIESAPGSGTTVTMLLPIDEPAVRSIAADETRQRILVVEDDAKVRKVLTLHLGRGGYAVDEVATAEEAVGLIENGLTPAILISDIRLSDGMTGVELLGLLRQQGHTFPMMLMTGFADELDADADTIGDIPVLRKPFRSAELLAEVQSLTGKRRSRRA